MSGIVMSRFGITASRFVGSSSGEVRSGSAMYQHCAGKVRFRTVVLSGVLVQLGVVSKVRSSCGRAMLLIIAFNGVLVKCHSTAYG